MNHFLKEQIQLDGIDAVNIINRALDDGLEDANVSNIPLVLQGDEQAKFYMDKFNYSIGYDLQGKVNSITIN